MCQYSFCILRARHTVPAIGPFWAQLARSAQSTWLCRAMQSALAARTHTSDRCAHPLAHMRGHLPCPLRGATRARPTHPLRLRADFPDDVETTTTSIESALSTRAMAGTTVESLRQTYGHKSASEGPIARSRDRRAAPKDFGQKRTFFEEQVQDRVDGGRRPKSRPLPPALRGMGTLLAGVEVGALLHSRISPALEPSLRTQHRPGEARSKRDEQKASSCEQPVGVVRAAHSAPLAARSGWTEVLFSGRASQPTFFASERL